MKILISFLVLIVLNENIKCFDCGVNLSRDYRFTPEAVIHQLSELIRYLILSGDVGNEIPVLDPYEFNFGQLNFTGEILRANMSITNGTCTGLGNYRLHKFYFSKSDIAINVEVNIPLLELYADYYELNGKIYDVIPIMGHGIVDIEVHNMILKGKLYLKQSVDGKSILLDKIEEPQFNIERIVSRTQFDNNIDAIINTMVEDLLADYLTRFSKYIAAAYSDTVVQQINPVLNKFETWNHIAVLLSASDE